MLLYPAAASAQVDVGVWTPGGGGRVVIGGGPVYHPAPAPVYYPPVYYPAAPVYVAPRPIYRPYYRPYYRAYYPARPVYVVPGYRHDRGRHLGWYKNGKAYRGYGNSRYYDRRYDGRRGRR
jgi:hypothetical protein